MILLYLDPGSGSILIQLLIAGLAGATIIIGSQWRKIRRWLKKDKSEPVAETKEEDEDEE